MSLTAQRRAVYPPRRNGVNRRGVSSWISAAVCAVGLPGGGCASAPKAPPTDYLIAVRYDVEPRLVGGDLSHNEGAVRSDFKTIANLGFNAVLLSHVEDGDRRALLDLAGEVGLKAMVPDRRFERYVVTGELPTDCRTAADLARASPDGSVHHPAFHSFFVDGGRGPSARERSRTLRMELLSRGSPPVPPEGNNETRLAVIDTQSIREGPAGGALERLLGRYHTALRAGQTDGVIVDRFMRVPGGPPGLTSSDDPLLPAHVSAVAALVQRARCWGPRLQGLSVNPIDAAATDSSRLDITVFSRGSRRCVLLFNTSPDRFLREEVRLPGSIAGPSVQRAVEVPPSSDRGAGQVVRAQRGRLALPVELRPGDAALFEVFSTGH